MLTDILNKFYNNSNLMIQNFSIDIFSVSNQNFSTVNKKIVENSRFFGDF